jgi:two-component system, OmpR family, response regulator
MSSTPAQRRARLLVVDDEPVIMELLAGALRFAGFDVLTAATGAEALRAAAASQPDLILLDVMMPGCDGFEVIRRIHDSGPRIPVIFLTARDTPHDRVAGLSLGGDDYITKPFSLDEMLARISAVLRRSTGEAEPASRLTIADLELDQDSHQVWRAGTEVTLAPREFKLLRYLMTNAGRVLSREQILDHVWDYNFTGDSNIIESYISTLRRKIDTAEPHLIHTIRSIGYVLRIPPP